MSFNPLELARMQADALYVHDAANRLLRHNEAEPEGPAPRFFLLRTPSGNIWRTRYDLPTGLSAALDRLAETEPVVAALHDAEDPPSHQAAYIELLERHAPVSSTDRGPAYYLPAPDPLAQVSNDPATVIITPENAALLEPHYPYTRKMYPEMAPVAVRVIGGVAVAACSSVRLTGQAAEAGVYTVEAYRGRGYGLEVVRAWAAALRITGRIPLYSTSWDNSASQAIAAKLGAIFYGEDFSIT